MQPTEPHVPESLDSIPAFRALLESLSDRLRSELSSVGFGPIEQLVGEARAEYRAAIFEELVIEEAQLRKMRGAEPSLDEYLRRFPSRVESVKSAWRRLQSHEAPSTVENQADESDPYVTMPGTESNTLVTAGAEPTHFGTYKVLRLLGSGTFGSVYKAQNESTGSIVAIKVLKTRWACDPDCGHAMRRQFAEEAKMMLQFDHPHVVRVISLDDRAEPPYFVQQYIDGDTLGNCLQATRPTLETALRYALQIADGLAHIHSRELWHRDLKPANILLDRDDHVYLADFGLALDDAQRWSSGSNIVGTCPYMAPEQVDGATQRLNARCDIWALGVILYEMLTGRRPFRGETREQLCFEIRERTPPAPSELNQSIPRELNRLCMQCLSKHDADRPHTAADLREDLAKILDQLSEKSSSTFASFASSDSTTKNDKGSSIPIPATIEYPIPTLKKFTAEQAGLYLRLMPKGYTTAEELPELITFWKKRIVEPDPDQTFAVGIMVGVSGCGKSSMLEAGLVPALPESIIPILIEASETDTEVRILSKLRRALPDADPDKKWSLVDWTFRMRSGNVLPQGKKVVFVLDQFEQWLNAHGGESTNQLLDALHQCDGEHLQAIVCVREGFHATLMRFVQAMRFKLDEERNYATAHRFTPDHARFVLTQFGRGLKRVDNPPTSQQQAFIDATIDVLAESDRGVVCVRLVVLALVMQDRPWSIDELNLLGGLEGIGSQFLVDCFEGRTASEQYRRYLPAAMRILAELLPAEGLEIKDVRSYDQLLVASELDKLQFDDLLNILVRKLFLLTPVEQVPVSSSPFSSSSSSSSVLQPPASKDETIEDNRSTLSLFYQLTHDFLVPSIREWLSRKLRETKAGRAQLRLQELTAAWTSKPQNRNLPSLWEWLTIRRLTDGKKWKTSEQTVMRRAGRVHAMRTGLLASAIAVLAVLGLAVRGQVKAQQERSRVEGWVAQLTTAEPAQVPAIVRQLDAAPELAQELMAPLLETEAKTIDQQRSKLHAQLAIVGRDASLVDTLLEELLSNKVAYISPIRELLQPHATVTIERLQAMLRDPQLETKRRFRAGVALAGFIDPASTWESQDLKFMATQLVTENAEYQPVLRDNLRPVSSQLLSPLEALFKDAQATNAMRLGAANAIADFAAKQPDLLTRLLADATPEQYEVLFALADKAKSESAIAELKQMAATLPPDELGSVDRIGYGQRRANAAVSLLRLGEREKVLPVFDYADDPEALTQFIFRCKPRGISVDALLDLFDLVVAAPGNYPKDARYALLLAIGEYAPSEIPTARRAALVKQLADWYAGDASSGVHGASGWLLRHLGEKEITDRVDQTPVPYSTDREWFTLAITVRPTPDTGLLGFLGLPPKTFYYTFIVHPSGEYTVGSVADQPERLKDEIRHAVTLTRPFAFLDREITFEELIAFSPEYAGFMQQYDAKPTDGGFGAHWYDSVAYCRWLGKEMGLPESDQCNADPETLDKEKYARDPQVTWAPRNWPLDLDKRGFRLPTESEWEVVARSGSRTAYGFGSEVALLDRFGWFIENSGKKVHPGRELRPSVRGLFDLHGNLFEWTHDWDGDFGESAQTDPLGAKGGSYRVGRGGGWLSTDCRAAGRNDITPANRSSYGGFRLALSPSSQVKAESVRAGEAEPSGAGTEGASAEQRPEMP